MKLLNKSLIYLSVSLFFVIGLWTVVFYFNMFREIKESIDEGLENYKRQIIYQAQKDPTILNKKARILTAPGFFILKRPTTGFVCSDVSCEPHSRLDESLAHASRIS